MELYKILIALFCLAGYGLHCWYLGRRNGIEGTLDHLTDQGILDEDYVNGEMNDNTEA